MWYIIVVIISAAAIVIGLCGCNLKSKKAGDVSDKNIVPHDTLDTIIKESYSRNDIKNKLESLASSPAPTDLMRGAMCYAPMPSRKNAEYICPKCGEKTLYAEEYGMYVYKNIPQCRTLADSITAIDLRLDESQFCKKCSPGKTNPQLCISFKFSDDLNASDYCGISVNDLKIMKEFLQGKDKHLEFNDAESPLKNYLPRLQELFGVKIDNVK